ncbi:MAG: tRNA (adenosine(37)-N6)-dimethylallyltransferase MiaA [Actinomycetota bacterium]
MAMVESLVLAIVGPTASGKSAVAMILAERLGGEVVSADSMQVYRGMDIGTAKPPTEVRERVRHHLIDIMDPSENCTAALFQSLARAAIEDIIERGKIPIIVGGTGLYVSAAVDNLHFPQTQETSEVRMRLQEEAEELGAFKLHSRLREIDPVGASNIHVNNTRRVIRALEVYELTGKKYSDVAGSFKKRRSLYDTVFMGLDYEKEELKRRIAVRTNRMIEKGWVEETRQLFAGDRLISRNAAQAIGYATLKQYIDGHLTMDEAVEQVIKTTSAYAKRQMTWFKADPRVVWLEPDVKDGAAELADEVVLYLKSIGKGVS